MNSTEEDERLALINPWKLTECQCMALRLVCCHGGLIEASRKEGVSRSTIKLNLTNAKKRIKYEGHDIRIYLDWDWWVRNL